MPNLNIVLPTTYYHDHFSEMIDFVLSVYGAFITSDEKSFIDEFYALGHDAQCLFIRMINRKKEIFCIEDLNYGEIDDIHESIQELLHSGFIRHVCENDFFDWLNTYNKAELVQFAKDFSVQDFKSSWSKIKAVTHLCGNLPYAAFCEKFSTGDYFLPLKKDRIGFFLYLYFGKLNNNLTSFALRDLGLISVKVQNNYQARFRHMEEARSGYFYTQALKSLKSANENGFVTLAGAIDEFPVADTDFVLEMRDKTIFKLGQFFEKRKELVKAAEIYQRSSSFESRERLVRILCASSDHDNARATLEEMIANPANDEEYIFATDFYERKFNQKKLGVYTDLLRQSPVIKVDDFHRGYPEYAAISHFEKTGWTCHHAENGLWPVIFALLFWEELFDDENALSSCFDLLPHTLKNKTFHLIHKDKIERIILAISSGKADCLLSDAINLYSGTENAVFYWFDGIAEMVAQFVETSPPSAVATIIEMMAQDFYSMRDGFPDLMMTRAGEIKFVEIKAEGDQIRRHQLARLNLLKRVGYQAEICRLEYVVDPEQSYVVLDVETTGGRPPYDRVTEIGAVKVRNGEIIGEWQSLINPERRIPAFITQLTGISNEMVKDAPTFDQVADDLEAFLNGSIFVAHNVNFDHGFIASEYRRLERPFKYPKLCTVSSMRKHYPGHASYGLANLCREYGIELTSHHRALHDAKAAAQLLKLVNQKRCQSQAA